MATPVARWLLDEASSGTGPTTCADDEGSNTLTIDYSSGDAVWVNVGAGNGLDYTASPATANTAIAQLEDISTNGNLGSSFDGATQCYMIFVVNVDNGHANGSRIFHIGTDSGNGDIGITHTTLGLFVRWDFEADGNENEFPAIDGSGLTIVHVVIDTTEATAADRVKVWYDGVSQTAVASNIAQNTSLGAINSTDRDICIGNRGSLNRNIDGAVYYMEIGTSLLTAGEISDSNTALAADNDADWDAVAGGTILPFRMRY